MTSANAFNLLIATLVVAYLCSRQLTWRPVDPARMWKLPLILGVLGVVALSRQTGALHPVDVVILGLSAAFALVSGALMGRIARFRPSPADPRLTESRTGPFGIAIWAGLIAVRIALDVAGHRMGSDLALSAGSILLVLALNRAASAFVVSARQPRRSLAMAGR
ncbi:hypothetical protein ACQP2F_18160 [Actinoplanes sp. CA-030573]|uniref:hypothetical protein n=1 Tax=Actinoplanes sp. CA-030573 TaxID=3239898 RepID=UPI003D89C13F